MGGVPEEEGVFIKSPEVRKTGRKNARKAAKPQYRKIVPEKAQTVARIKPKTYNLIQ